MTASGPSRIQVVLVEAHTLVRDGVRALLDRVEDIEVVGEVSGLAALDDVEVVPDVVVTDLLLPDGSGASVVAEVRRRFPDASVLVLSVIADLATIEAVLQAGASGYVRKDVTSAELFEAIRTVAAHGEYLQPELGAALTRRLRTRRPGLSERDRSVLRLIALGHTHAEIADRLGLSLRTIETSRARVSDAISATSRAQLVRYALEHGLLRETGEW